MGRRRKKLIDKKSTIMLYIDNTTLFMLCDKLNIEYDPDANVFEEETISKIKEEIINILKDYVK